MTTNTELSTELNESPAAALPVAYTAESLEQLFSKVEQEVKAHVPDIETVEGRKHIKSLAAKISSSKTAIDKPMRDYLREIKALPKVVEKNARESKERFEKLHAETLATLSEAQAPQDAIIERMDEIVRLCSMDGVTSVTVAGWHKEVCSVEVETTFWPELIKKAKASYEGAIAVTAATLNRLIKSEKQAAELERLRKQAEENEQKERERVIAQQAADKAREEEQLRAEQRILDERNKAEQARLAQLEAERIAANNALLAANAEAKAKSDAEEAERLAKIREQEAADNSRKHAEQQQALEAQRIKDEEERRANDKAHRIAINREILVAIITDEKFCELVAEDKRDEVAKAIITLAAKGLSGQMKVLY